jgi:hypothetical protein
MKYFITDITHPIIPSLRRIQSLKDFSDVRKGDLGGYIDASSYLSHFGESWIYDDAIVRNSSAIIDDAIVTGKSIVANNSLCCDYATVSDSVVGYSCSVSGAAHLSNKSEIFNQVDVFGRVKLDGDTINGPCVVSLRPLKVYFSNYPSDDLIRFVKVTKLRNQDYYCVFGDGGSKEHILEKFSKQVIYKDLKENIDKLYELDNQT